jgi:two-component system alkaline phosphatase synthesis response regulator PhoP
MRKATGSARTARRSSKSGTKKDPRAIKTSQKILVVEDEKNIAKVVGYNLEKEGFEVVLAGDGEQALKLVREADPDLVILDLMLPKLDGLEVCRQIRADAKRARLPIIMLTAKTQETDRVVGLEMGADDYISKPFSPRELVARVKAVLRRARGQAEIPTVWKCGSLEVDWERRIVKVKQKPVALTPKEFELLHALIEREGRVLSREKLLEQVWGFDQAAEIQSRTVDLHVSQLRQKLGAEGKRILTVTGAGYRFQMPDEE